MKIYHSDGEYSMFEINHDTKEVFVDVKEVTIGSMEDRIIKGLASRGYAIREKSKCTALTVVNDAPKSQMYKKFEVVYQMRKSEDDAFEKTRYVARLFAKNEDDVWKNMTSTFVNVLEVYKVPKVRSDYLKKQNKKFHSMGG